MKKYFLVAAILMGAAPSARGGDSLGDMLRDAGEKILGTVDCGTLCQKDLCGIQNFKDFCETLCSKKDDVKDCKKVDSYPFVFEKGKVVFTPTYQTLLAAGETALGVFCQVRCNEDACKENHKLATLCIKSCAPNTVVNCKAASGL
ncbi:MAG: hypothetical protein ACRCUQ_04725 [Alphaproteobacteria bacterium]